MTIFWSVKFPAEHDKHPDVVYYEKKASNTCMFYILSFYPWKAEKKNDNIYIEDFVWSATENTDR